MYLASEVQERSNAPVPGQTLATKVSKSCAISLYVPGVKPPGWPLITALVAGYSEVAPFLRQRSDIQNFTGISKS